MNSQDRIPFNGSGFTDGEEELAQVLDAYLVLVEAGRPVDPEELVARHPAIADRLPEPASRASTWWRRRPRRHGRRRPVGPIQDQCGRRRGGQFARARS